MHTDSELIARKAAIVARHGPWTAHNVRLAEGIFTIGPEPSGDEVKLQRVVQIVSDLAPRPISDLRILDLACLEGMYSLELARRGAAVHAIEGRLANLEKARFAAEALGLEVELELGDVRALRAEQHGSFDVVLCLGILYHLDAPDVFELVGRLASVCSGILVLDTHVALAALEQREYRGRLYGGASLFEHEPDATEEERLGAVWSSLDNARAFAPTKASLLNLLADEGFSSAYECQLPFEAEKPPDRITIVARRGEPVQPILTPAPPVVARLPEDATRQRPLGARIGAALPAPAKAALRRAVGRPTPPRR